MRAMFLLYALIAWRGIKIIAVAPTLFTAAAAGAKAGCPVSKVLKAAAISMTAALDG